MMEEDLVTFFCISCGFVGTLPRTGVTHETKRAVCPKCRYSFRISGCLADVQPRTLPAGVLMV
ncbi:hypothetical protein F6V30_00515 [Oryzomonas sagensis]|uniref:Uncharacterized protein n=1 Tax=Oryzomonas sagensis TaxID=2603857 RepID=A0ABQ6TQT3_9BACT|nr:hypothetical protein [Oryzomonas sagensis]KAB0671109.1 hypothetical protein F6V30_00515 [Oryzomonas sagensis]